jgi:XTP/dITP diphosphohydrolase
MLPRLPPACWRCRTIPGSASTRLGGDPGVYTADWAGPQRDFTHAMKRLEDALQAANATTPSQRRGSFNATLCLAHPDGRDWLIDAGKGRGHAGLAAARRSRLTAFDPVFMPDGYDITFGQMPSRHET